MVLPLEIGRHLDLSFTTSHQDHPFSPLGSFSRRLHHYKEGYAPQTVHISRSDTKGLILPIYGIDICPHVDHITQDVVRAILFLALDTTWGQIQVVAE